MDYAKMISSVAGGMKDQSKSSNSELSSMMADLGISLDEEAKQRDASYADAFTKYREAQTRGLAEREMAAGAAANAAANAAGPSPQAPQMATGAAYSGGPVGGDTTAAKAAFARSAMGGAPPPGTNLGAPGPSAALQNVQIDPATGMAVAGGGPPMPAPLGVGAPQQGQPAPGNLGAMGPSAALQNVQIDPRTGLATAITPEMMAAYGRTRGF